MEGFLPGHGILEIRITAQIRPLQNPSYKYSDTGIKSVTFIVANSKGCLDSVTKPIHMRINHPFFSLSRYPDLQYRYASVACPGKWRFYLEPIANMINPDSADPFVNPKPLPSNGNTEPAGMYKSDSLRVRVVDHVTLFPGNDSTICLGDTITLNPSGDGLYFTWSPSNSLDNPT